MVYQQFINYPSLRFDNIARRCGCGDRQADVDARVRSLAGACISSICSTGIPRSYLVASSSVCAGPCAGQECAADAAR
jgi:hypothetical protein